MKITLYKFGKKRNSTKQPDGEGLTFDFNFLDNSSMLNPVIGLSSDAQLWEYNYAYIDTLKRFYFVSDWTSRGNIWSCSLSADVLASWKEEIGNSTQYIERSSASFNGYFPDTHYPSNSNTQVVSARTDPAGNPFTSVLAQGSYIIGILNSDNNSVGAVSYYVMNDYQFRWFSDILMNTLEWADISVAEISAELAKLLFNPFKFITSCVWYPFRVAGGGASVNRIKLGYWEIPFSEPIATRLVNFTHSTVLHFPVPKHPQAFRGQYLNKPPYSTYRLEWPCFGSFSLDGDIAGIANSLSAVCLTDLIGGSATLRIFDRGKSSGGYALSTQVSVGVPIQMAQFTNDILGAYKGITNSIGNVSGGNVYGFANAVYDYIQTSRHVETSTINSNSAISSYTYEPILICTFNPVADENNAKFGKPLFSTRKINGIPGYIKVIDAQLDIDTVSDNERNEIESAMNGGFYYE